MQLGRLSSRTRWVRLPTWVHQRFLQQHTSLALRDRFLYQTGEHPSFIGPERIRDDDGGHKKETAWTTDDARRNSTEFLDENEWNVGHPSHIVQDKRTPTIEMLKNDNPQLRSRKGLHNSFKLSTTEN